MAQSLPAAAGYTVAMIGLSGGVAKAFSQDKVMRLAAAIAFAAIFSVAPLIIVVIATLGWFFGINNGGHGHHVAENVILEQVSRAGGPQIAETVRQMVAAAFNKPKQNIIAQVVGWVAFIVGAAGLFATLQDALNAIWHVEETKAGTRQIVRDRAASFGMIVIVMLLLLATFSANAVVAFLVTHFSTPLSRVLNSWLVTSANQTITFVVATVAFAAIYKVLPDARIAWRDVWVGAVATALLFVVGEALIALYLSRAAVASAYGAAGSCLATLLWIYYSAVIFLIGAEVTKVLAGRRSDRV